MKYILSIDQGTTGSRAIIYDKQGKKRASAYQEFKQYFPKPGWVEHNPVEIWKSVNNTIQSVLKKVPSNLIAAIGITNQRETTTGLPIDAYFSATKIEWILKNVKGARAMAKAGELAFGTTDSWILWNLTGGKTHSTDYSNASRTMLFNIKQMKWDVSLLKKFKIPKSMLPEVKRSSGEFGVTARIGKLSAGIPIAGIAGDQQAALFGQACFEPGTMKNTYGTGAVVLLNTGKNLVESKSGLITTIGCGAKGEPVYILEGAIKFEGTFLRTD